MDSRLNVDITLKNYRCFADSNPASISLRDGFTSFIGVNNCGKSNVLKFFHELRSLFSTLSTVERLRDKLKHASLNCEKRGSTYDDEELFHDRNNRGITVDLALPKKTIEPNYDTIRLKINRDSNLRAQAQFPKVSTNPEAILAHSNAGVVIKGYENTTIEKHLKPFCDVFSILSQVLYIGAFRNAINLGEHQNYYDISVGQSFVKHWGQLKSGDKKQNAIKANETTADVARLVNAKQLEINPSHDDTTLQINLNGRPYKLAELGSGIAQLILVFVNAATRNPSLILIDEPELNLHPSLQIDFLTTLASYSRFGVLFSTHNIGLARAASDRIYSVSLGDDCSSIHPYERTSNLAEFLGELSFAGYQELGFDKILLVEGSTEVRTIQQLLRLVKKDHMIVMLSLGGSDMINSRSELELGEIKRISPNIFALIDSDFDEHGVVPQDRVEFSERCKAHNIKCHTLERRAIENYFPEHAIQSELGPKYTALGEKESLSSREQFGWSKRENWRIARHIVLDDLVGTDLLELLQEL